MLAVVTFGVGCWLWISGKSGSKRAQLGTNLLSAVGVGIVGLAIQQVFASGADRRQEEAAAGLVTGGTPPQDPEAQSATVFPETVRTETQVGRAMIVTAAMRSYELRYDKTLRDTSRVDALQMRTRVFTHQDHEYFQFVTAVIPAPELRGFVPSEQLPRGRLEKALALAMLEPIKDAIHRGVIPLNDPTQAFEVYPDIDAAVRRARAEPTLGEIRTGDVVGERFEVDTPITGTPGPSTGPSDNRPVDGPDLGPPPP